METIKIGDYTYILSKEKPKQGDSYLCILTDSTGVKLFTGIRLETDKTIDSHKNCIKILATDNFGLNFEGCPSLNLIK